MQPAFGLYTHIRANAFRSAALIVGLFALVYVLTFGYSLVINALDGGTFEEIVHAAAATTLRLAPFVTVGAIGWVGVAFAFNRSIVGAISGSRSATRQTHPHLYNLLENLCISRGMTMPALAVIETQELNAFASGITEDQYTVTVTRGLLEALDDDEIEAVIAHELTHIRNHDVRLMVISAIMVGMIAIAIEFAFRSAFYSRGYRSSRGNSKGGNGALPAILLGLALIGAAWFLSKVMNFALSRKREYMADAGAVELTKNPDAMISALRKIEGNSNIESMPSDMMEMCIDNPRKGFASLFATHPSMDDRVTALKNFAGGTDLGTERTGSRRIAERYEPPTRAPQIAKPQSDEPFGPWGFPVGNPERLPEGLIIADAILREDRHDRQRARRQTRSRPAPSRTGTSSMPRGRSFADTARQQKPARKQFGTAGKKAAPKAPTNGPWGVEPA